MLQGHQAVFTVERDLVRYLIWKLCSRGALLWREGKYAHVVELLLGHKIQQMLKLLLRFAGEAHDEGSAQHRLGQLLADAAKHPGGHVCLPGAVHSPQHVGVAVLKRQV